MNKIKKNWEFLSMIALFLFLIAVKPANAGTCTSDSYTASSANAVLTSTKYNSDHSTIYDRLAGNLDGGCISDGTIEKSGLQAADFASLYNGVHEGCKLTRSDAATISVDRCILTLGGNQVKTTGANTVTWGCSGCSAEAASTDYYVYAKSDSDGTTLNLLISTSAPNNDGFDGSGNKALGNFWNDGSSDIDGGSITPWVKTDLARNQGTSILGIKEWSGTTNCVWTRTTNSIGDFPVDADCDDNARTFYGLAVPDSSNDGQLPQVKISSVPAGVITAEINAGYIGNSTSANTNCHFRISDGTNNGNISGGGGNTIDVKGWSSIESSIVYTTDQSDVTFKVQGYCGTASSVVSSGVYSLNTDGQLQIIIKHTPLRH